MGALVGMKRGTRVKVSVPYTYFNRHIRQCILSTWKHVWNGAVSNEFHCQASSGKEGSVLFNDALNTFYLRLYGVRHIMVKDHSDSERRNLLPPHGLLFPISS